MEFNPVVVPSLGIADYSSVPKYYRVWHSKTQRNPNEFVAEEVETKIVKAKNERDAKNRVKNTYKHHVLKAEEITDISDINAIKQMLFEKKSEEVV